MAIFEVAPDISGGRRKIILKSPSTLEPIGELECQTKADVDQAVAKARASQPAWGALSIEQRVAHMLRLRDVIIEKQDEIIETVVRETGKPLQDAMVFEVYAVCDFIAYWCKQAVKVLKDEKVRVPGPLKFMKKLRVVYKPLGVVGIITPWNGPFVLTANPAVQAMLAGNSVIVKGSEVTPYSAKIFEKYCAEAGIPDGVCQVLMGDGETGAHLTSADINKVSFTGSVATGKKIAMACSERLIPFTLELGGKDAMIVCADADLDDAASGAVWGSCVNTGHFCCGVERIYVEEPVYDAFVEKVVAIAKNLKQGPEHGTEESLGAVFWDRQMTIIENHVNDAKNRGAKTLCGGERLKDKKGLYFPATVMVDVDEKSDLMTQETFGPVLPIIKVKNVEEAITKANDSNYGLHGSVWTKNIDKGIEIARRVDTGSMAVNDIGMMYGIASAPFGGVKESGMGSVNGQNALRGYCHAQPIISGKYGGKQSAYPYDQSKFDQMKKALTFIHQNPIGRFLLG